MIKEKISLDGEDLILISGVNYNTDNTKSNYIVCENDHGKCWKTRFLENNKSPAHIHIVEKRMKPNKSGRINITGPVPKIVSDITQYPGKGIVQLNNDELSKLLDWFNSMEEEPVPFNMWESVQNHWIDIHYNTQYNLDIEATEDEIEEIGYKKNDKDMNEDDKIIDHYIRPLSFERLEAICSKQMIKSMKENYIVAWRAYTGIEIMHKEYSKKKMIRIWQNWQYMSEKMKEISDNKLVELCGRTNKREFDRVMNTDYREYNTLQYEIKR
jgi:hypothetical protein